MNAETKVKPATSLCAAMAAAFPKIEGASKDKNNPHFKSKYADLSSVVEAIKPALVEHSLFFVQNTEPSDAGVIVETVICHSSGETMSLGKLFVPANKNDAQGFGSALTYARRYSLMTAFGVAPEDDDGNAASKASARPMTGELPPAKRQPLDGPYASPSTLKAAIKAFVGTMEGMTDFAEFNAFMETPDVIELEKQALRDLPAWWDTGEGMPDEFEPVSSRIHRKKRALEEADDIHSNARTVIDAG